MLLDLCLLNPHPKFFLVFDHLILVTFSKKVSQAMHLLIKVSTLNIESRQLGLVSKCNPDRHYNLTQFGFSLFFVLRFPLILSHKI